LEEYARAVWQRQQAALALQAAQQKLESTWLLSQQELNGGSPAGFVGQLRDYCRVLEETVRGCQAALDKAETVVAQSWQKLLAIRQAREAVEKLHDQRRREHDREVQVEEQKLLDEMALRTVATPLTMSIESDAVWN
ncbi:MAG TPA: flagellar export protein FliJ, partial [Verrucomicrobiae bacterium]|nr:flagellar export protein FliJ [Verrucomicrobiae bacterium]